MKKYFYIESINKGDFIYYSFKNFIDGTLITIGYNKEYNFYNCKVSSLYDAVSLFHAESKREVLKKLYKYNILLNNGKFSF